MAHTQVPKFGNWESEEVPYTMYFDNARKGKKSGQIHEIDPYVEGEFKDGKASKHQESDVTRSPRNPTQLGTSEKSHALKVVGAMHDQRSEGEMKTRLTDSPMRHENTGRRNSSPGNTPRRVGRSSVGSDRSADESPMHPHSQARAAGAKGNNGSLFPSWGRKASSDGSHNQASTTPRRSRLRSVAQADDSPDRSPAVPKFGEWDETDPSAAEGYTQMFNRVREEKNSETKKVAAMLTETTSQSYAQKQYAKDDTKGCGCFPWAKR